MATVYVISGDGAVWLWEDSDVLDAQCFGHYAKE